RFRGIAANADQLQKIADDTSASIQQIAASIEQVAQNAQNVNALTDQVQADAREGRQAVGQSLVGMKEIADVVRQASAVITNLGKSSEEIGSIIEVIDDIA